jgi:Kdo2-lipid IVA lauroyltransferase/acyltransferase
MKRTVYYLFLIGINLFRIIPFWLLRIVECKVYILIFYVAKYRRKVVIGNLTKCFPEKTGLEVAQLSKQFYKQNLAPIFAETIKGFTMSHNDILKRYKVVNPEILDPYFEQGRDVLALASHYGNWEWGILGVNLQIKHQAAALYKPLSNTYIDKYSNKLRQKNGMQLVSIFDTKAYFAAKKEKPVLYIMAADQNPGNVTKAIWVDFLGRDTACLHGPEHYARSANLPIVFFDVQRIKNGYYELTIKILEDNPTNCKSGEITQKYMSALEGAIRKKPENWLWSHKRWKHKR